MDNETTPFSMSLVRNWVQLMGVLVICALFGFQREVMIANVLMLVMFYFLLVVPILWCLRPAKLVKRF